MKVRPPDPEAVERYMLRMAGETLYRDPGSLPEVSSPSLFGDGRPLEMEIGCGGGEFICALAERDPEANFVGVDLHTKSVYKAIKRASGRGLGNVRFIVADFRFIYPRLVPGSLRAVYLHFPDPGIKRKLRKQRIFNRRFLEEIHKALVPGGLLSVVSDHTGYFFDMLELVCWDGRWEKAHEGPYLVGFEPEVKSRFQKMWESRGRVPLRFELVKCGENGRVAGPAMRRLGV